MSIEVYIWEMRRDDMVGHAAMALSDQLTYISWWPEDDIEAERLLFDVKGIPVNSYTDDVERKERYADRVIHIRAGLIDEDAIREWWEDFKQKAIYNLTTQNCSQAVYTALFTGKSHNLYPLPATLNSNPKFVGDYAEKLRDAAADQDEL